MRFEYLHTNLNIACYVVAKISQVFSMGTGMRCKHTQTSLHTYDTFGVTLRFSSGLECRCGFGVTLRLQRRQKSIQSRGEKDFVL